MKFEMKFVKGLVLQGHVIKSHASRGPFMNLVFHINRADNAMKFEVKFVKGLVLQDHVVKSHPSRGAFINLVFCPLWRTVTDHREDVIDLFPGVFTTVKMIPDSTGR